MTNHLTTPKINGFLGGDLDLSKYDIDENDGSRPNFGQYPTKQPYWLHSSAYYLMSSEAKINKEYRELASVNIEPKSLGFMPHSCLKALPPPGVKLGLARDTTQPCP